MLAVPDTSEPGGASMNGMNLSGKPGMVQPMQMPPTLGQPPMPAIQPRFGTLQLTTGPQQPSFTMHLGEPYSVAKSPCSEYLPRSQPSWTVLPKSQVGRPASSSGIIGAK